MSYILDALRRADAERERGAVPGLHAQAQPITALAPGGPRAAVPWLIGAGAGGVVLLLGALAWWSAGGRAVPAQPVGSTAAGTVAGTAASAATSAAALAPPATAAVPPDAEPPLAGAPLPRLSPASPVLPVPAGTVAGNAREPEPGAEPEPETRAPSRSKPPLATPGDKPRPAERRIYTLDELPPEIRRSLPQVAISGSIYSEDAASRFVMVNGEVVHEGGRLGPELTLEQIQLKSAVLLFKGYRYRIGL